MATMLKDLPPPSEIQDIPEMRTADVGEGPQLLELAPDEPGGQIFIPESDPTTNPLPTPERIIVRELTVAFVDKGPFVYARPDRYHPCSSLGDVATMINTIRTNNYNPQVDSAPYYRPLDLHLGAATCFIIRLTDQLSWRFSRKQMGASLGLFEYPNDKNNYYDLRHVLSDNTGQPGQFEQHDQFCRLIYFIAKPVIGRPFNHPFNLNVEFVFKDGPAGEENTLPIMIDPDVRFPGGSGE